MSSDLKVLTGNKIFLSESRNLGPATIEIDKSSGRITAIHPERRSKQSHYAHLDDVDYSDVGDLNVIPGLIEYVCSTLI
jgi:allantoinase